MDKMKDTNLISNSISNSASSKHDVILSAGNDVGLTSDILEIEELNKDKGKLVLRETSIWISYLLYLGKAEILS